MPDFSTLAAFELLDVKKFKYLDFETFYLFLKHYSKGGFAPTRKHINAIYRRLDLNADAKITFNEFAEAIRPIDVYCCSKGEPDKEGLEAKKRKVEEAREESIRRQEGRANPLRTFTSMIVVDSPVKVDFSSPVRRKKTSAHHRELSTSVKKDYQQDISKDSENVTPIKFSYSPE